MPCKKCQSDPQPANFGSPRKCAFLDSGEFTEDNWNCATISALLEHAEEHRGDDETLEIITVPSEPEPEWEFNYASDGWIITTRYKQRGQTSGGLHVRWNGSGPLTLRLAERVIEAYAKLNQPST